MTSATSVYNGLADSYDARYQSSENLKENMIVRGLVLDYANRYLQVPYETCDIGAGTGLALELGLAFYPQHYVAIDPSGNMLDKLKHKFPLATTFHGTLAQYGDKFKDNTLFLGLFGVASYMSPEDLKKVHQQVTSSNSIAFLMALAEGYWPDYWDKEPPSSPKARETLRELPNAHHILTLSGNYETWVILP